VKEGTLVSTSKAKAEAALQERAFDIIPAEEIRVSAETALASGNFVSGYESLVTSSFCWEEQDDGVLAKEFYHRTEDHPEGEYAKAVAYVFEGGELHDFYVVDVRNNEI
jgi:hypothetical protein